MRRAVVIFSLCWSVFLGARAQSPAEASSGTIAGRVIDPQGAVIAHAVITTTEDSTAKRYQTTTDGQGEFQLSGLTAGNYTVLFERRAFRAETRSVSVNPGQTAQLEVKLRIGPEDQGPAPELEPKPVPVTVCTATCPIEDLFIPTPYPAIRLQVQADESSAGSGFERWIRVKLTNTAKHTIVIKGDRDLSPSFDYEIYAYGSCDCPGKLRKGHLMTSHTVKLRPGESISDKFDLRDLIGSTEPDTYAVLVERRDTSLDRKGVESKEQPVVRSNVITVRVDARTEHKH